MIRITFLKDRSGSSSTIGIILIVAMVVILAAVIAAFSMGMLGDVKKTNFEVWITASRVDNQHIVISNMGGTDAKNLNDVNPFTIMINNAEVAVPASLNKEVGSSAVFDVQYDGYIVVVCHFTDTSEYVVMLGMV